MAAFLAGLTSALGGSAGTGIGQTLGKVAGQGLLQFGNTMLSNLADGLSFGFSADRRKMRKQQQYALEQMAVQNQYALQQMNHQQMLNRQQYDYEYGKESPLARVQQLRDAGLNSGLMYGQGAGGAGMQGSVGTVSTPSGPSGHNISGGHMMASNLLANALNQQQMQSAIDRNNAEADMFRATAEEKRGQTDPSKVRMALDRARANAESALAKSHEATASYTKAQEDLFNALKPGKIEEQSLSLEQARVAIDEGKERINNLIKEGRLTEEEIVHMQKLNRQCDIDYALAQIKLKVEQYYHINLQPAELEKIQKEIDLLVQEEALTKEKASTWSKDRENERRNRTWNTIINAYDKTVNASLDRRNDRKISGDKSRSQERQSLMALLVKLCIVFAK